MPDHPRADFGVLLRVASVTFFDGLTKHLAAGGFDDYVPRYGYVLRYLHDEPVSLRELAAELRMTSPGALKLVTAMTEAGYVERIKVPDDRRLHLVGATERGRQVLAAARAYHHEAERRLADEVGADAVANARAVLERLAFEDSGLIPPGLWRE